MYLLCLYLRAVPECDRNLLVAADRDELDHAAQKAVEEPVVNATEPKEKGLKEHQLVYEEGQKGVSYDVLFGPYLAGAAEILVTDPYIRAYFQIRNMMEFLETVARFKAPEDEVHVKLITCPDEFNSAQCESQ